MMLPGSMSCEPELAYVAGHTIFAPVVLESREGERLEIRKS